VYYNLSAALKRRLVNELQDSFSKHPVYEKIVGSIQNKYAFEARPEFGIVVKGASGNKVSMAADNFIGTVQSHVMLAYYGTPAYPIEWVREDQAAIAQNNGVFPILPGVYYIEILTAPTNVTDPGQYMVDPLLTVTQESVRVFQSGVEHEGQLENAPIKGTLRLYENAYYMLKEGRDYTVEYETGKIAFLTSFNPKSAVIADYRFSAPSLGPIDFWWNRPDATTLPGVVLAFGKRARAGDKVVVVVYPDRVDAARAYGGKFEYTFDLDVIAQDPMQMEEIADLVIMYLWAYKKPELEFEGIEILDINAGGEAEEQKDETADIFFYTASMSVQLRADWEIHVPLPLTISKVTATNEETNESRIKTTTSSLFIATAPIFKGRNNDFERIS
jgi:hypothetical protein